MVTPIANNKLLNG